MKLIKRTASHAIYQRRDGRYAVRSTRRQAINGEEKVRVLLAEGLLKAPVTKTVEPESAAAETEAGDSAEAGDAEQAENAGE